MLEMIQVPTPNFLPQIHSTWDHSQSLFRWGVFCETSVFKKQHKSPSQDLYQVKTKTIPLKGRLFWKERKVQHAVTAVAQGAAHLAQLLRKAADWEGSKPFNGRVKEAWVINKATSDNAIPLICFCLLKYQLLKNVGIKRYSNQTHLQVDSWSYTFTTALLLNNVGQIK